MFLNSGIYLKNDITTNWSTFNPILKEGEPGYDTQARKLKIGDGTTPWESLDTIGVSSLDYSYPGGTLTNGVAANTQPNKAIADTDIIWALGTNFGTTTFSNPIDGTRIIQTNSGILSGYSSPVILADRTQGTAATANEYASTNVSNSWFRLNFGSTRKVKITKIAIQQRGAATTSLHRSLTISYSTNGTTFTPATYFTASTSQLGWSTFNVGNYIDAQHVEVKHSSTSSSGSNNFCASEILIWGYITRV